MAKQIKNVIFDLGGVLIDWNPRYLYHNFFPNDNEAMERFLSTVCTREWVYQMDAGKSFDESATELKAKHPNQAKLIEAWLSGFDKMMAGAITGTVKILERVRVNTSNLYALTNWSADTFPYAKSRFDFLAWFDGIVVSGHEKLAKPDPKIFALIAERYGLDPQQTIFIDDHDPNIETALNLGFHALKFTTPEKLESDLKKYSILT